MTTTVTMPKPGDVILVETKPFVDSDRLCLAEVAVVAVDSLHVQVTRNGCGRFYIPRETILDWCEA